MGLKIFEADQRRKLWKVVAAVGSVMQMIGNYCAVNWKVFLVAMWWGIHRWKQKIEVLIWFVDNANKKLRENLYFLIHSICFDQIRFSLLRTVSKQNYLILNSQRPETVQAPAEISKSDCLMQYRRKCV